MARPSTLPKLKKACVEVSALLRALSHPKRLMIMGYLVDEEKTVGELQELCGISQSQLSQFLMRMKFEKLVTCHRRGRFQYYTVADERMVDLIVAIQRIYCD